MRPLFMTVPSTFRGVIGCIRGSSLIPCSLASLLLKNCPSAPESTRADVSTVSFPTLSEIGTVNDDVFLLDITTGEIRISDGDSVGLFRLRQNPLLLADQERPPFLPPAFRLARLGSLLPAL